MKKKILIIGPTYPFRGGNSLFVTFLYEVLSNNYQVQIFNYSLLYPDILFPGKTQFDFSNIVKKVDSLRIINSVNPFNWLKVAILINKANPDLIIFDWWHPFFSLCHFTISFFLNKKLKNRIVFITENFISHEEKYFENILTRIGLSNAKYFIALSDKVAKDLNLVSKKRKIYRSELPIYSHLKDENYNKKELKRKFQFDEIDKIILFFGYVRKYKGLDLLIESVKLISDTHPQLNLKLLVAGEFYEDVKFYLNIINDLDLKPKIKIFNEYIPNEKVKEFFLVSDLVVLPYRSATQSGILNLAYGFCKPVVVTDVGGLAEFVVDEHTGVIAKSSNPNDISQAILKYFELSSKIDFPKNIYNYTNKNNFRNFSEIIESIFQDIEYQRRFRE